MQEERVVISDLAAEVDGLSRQRTRLNRIVLGRQDLIARVGTGQIKVSRSWEDAIRVGEVRGRVRKSIERINDKLAPLDAAFLDRLDDLEAKMTLRRGQLDRMKEMVGEGALSAEEVEPFETEFALLKTYAERLPQTEVARAAEVEAITPATEPSESTDSEFVVTTEQIPGLLEQLARITTINEHKYDLSNTVSAKLPEALAVDEADRTDEQRDLLKMVEVMKKYAPSEGYMEVYTPAELRGLVEMLTILSMKIRPDFAELEDQMLEIINRLKGDYFGSTLYESMKGVIDRANRDDAYRRGMNWDTLNRMASLASGFIDERMKSPEMRSYFVDVKDPEPTKEHNLTSLYQFAADIYTHEVIGKRSIKADKARKDSFVANCQVVNEWFAKVEPVLQQIDDRRGLNRLQEYIGQTSQGREVSGDRLARGMAYVIREMVTAMNQRLAGGDTFGKNKDYQIDPVGAISLQLKIGHTAKELRKLIEEASQGTLRPQVIVPLPV